jgi:hypothetical protein
VALLFLRRPLRSLRIRLPRLRLFSTPLLLLLLLLRLRGRLGMRLLGLLGTLRGSLPGLALLLLRWPSLLWRGTFLLVLLWRLPFGLALFFFVLALRA